MDKEHILSRLKLDKSNSAKVSKELEESALKLINATAESQQSILLLSFLEAHQSYVKKNFSLDGMDYDKAIATQTYHLEMLETLFGDLIEKHGETNSKNPIVVAKLNLENLRGLKEDLKHDSAVTKDLVKLVSSSSVTAIFNELNYFVGQNAGGREVIAARFNMVLSGVSFPCTFISDAELNSDGSGAYQPPANIASAKFFLSEVGTHDFMLWLHNFKDKEWREKHTDKIMGNKAFVDVSSLTEEDITLSQSKFNAVGISDVNDFGILNAYFTFFLGYKALKGGDGFAEINR